MENLSFENKIESKENPIKFDFLYGVELEINRVKNTIKKLPWFRERGYSNIILPKGLQDELKLDDINGVISSEYSEDDYKKVSTLIEAKLLNFRERLIKLEELKSFKLLEKYEIVLTKYGSGGSYYDKGVHVLIYNRSVQEIFGTLIHEIVHIGIEHLIKKYNIKHWHKERLVDLIMDKFFPDLKKKQKIPEDVGVIDNVFNNHFPDIHKIVREISENKL